MTALAKHLEATGQAQSAFAKRVGVTQATISRIVHGRIPGPRLVKRIIAATDGSVTLDDLYEQAFP